MAIHHLDDLFWKYWKWDFGTQFLLISNYYMYADRSIDNWLAGKKYDQCSCLLVSLPDGRCCKRVKVGFCFYFLNEEWM